MQNSSGQSPLFVYPYFYRIAPPLVSTLNRYFMLTLCSGTRSTRGNFRHTKMQTFYPGLAVTVCPENAGDRRRRRPPVAAGRRGLWGAGRDRQVPRGRRRRRRQPGQGQCGLHQREGRDSMFDVDWFISVTPSLASRCFAKLHSICKEYQNSHQFHTNFGGQNGINSVKVRFCKEKLYQLAAIYNTQERVDTII